MRCFWFAALIFLGVLIVGMWAIRNGLLEFGSFYSSDLKKSCMQQFYLPYPPLPETLFDGGLLFNPQNGAFLMTVAYNTSLSNCKVLGQFPKPPGATDMTYVEGYSADGIRRMFARVITYPNAKIISFTGTEFIDEFVMDFEGTQTTPSILKNQPGVLVHSGFWSIYESLQEELHTLIGDSPVIITGHSLGGALSTIASLDFPNVIATYTFASPRVFNPLGATLVQSFRIYNTEDIVPSLPPAVFLEWEYSHPPTGGIPFTLNDGTIDATHVDAYLQFFGL